MNDLDRLAEVIELERQALTDGDWALLDRCTADKEALVEPLSRAGVSPGDKDRIVSLRQAINHNSKLAAAAARQTSQLVHGAHKKAAGTYTAHGRVSVSRFAVVHRMG